MNSFLDNFQPFIVHLVDDLCIPKSCRGQYMLCVNAMGIQWFEENYIKMEFGDHLIEGEGLGPKYLLLEDSDANKLDMPRIYIPITLELANNDAKLGEFLIKGLTDEKVYADGIDGFRPSKDFYVNETLYKYLTRDKDHIGDDIQSIAEENDDIYLPDYLFYDRVTDTARVDSNYFLDLDDDEKRSRDLTFFYRKNEISKLKFSSYDFDFLPQTFFRLVLQYTKIGDAVRMVSPNNVYDAVQNYWANHKSDEATRLLQTILQTPAKTATDLTPTLNTCNSCTNTPSLSSSSSSIIEKTCYEKYVSAMDEWLSIMLGDVNYNLSWMMETQPNMKFPNFDLIDLLIQLLKEYIEYGKFPKSEEVKNFQCDCPSLDSSYSDDECIKNTILNYIKVLEWTKKCELSKNKNKTKVYGQELAKLFQKFM